ncbi:TrmH family RNA methyltransferase [Tenacibaculum jejuense]|uniref:Probable tRNA/rRNA methyltransferase n=1 Tax=Tenacibaculum jejuense TaxID=584609 RepID=A0A238UFI3_9FLAO|nr:RNA methyltransferase [Tenacibaculum jejuense]SNR17338.1 Probable tRNA/rRNA methyltransferase [Tenacibaculum jejuense]
MSLSKNQIKLINSLRQKKYRKINQLFIAEGVKVVNELLSSNLKVNSIFATEDYVLDEQYTKIRTLISETELKKITALKTPNKVLGVFHIPEVNEVEDEGLIVALDAINDPGNLGTIIRLCDWFGIQKLVCSTDTVDCYNQKVIQSTMGSISRVHISYEDLEEYLTSTDLPSFVADMEGENVYTTKLPQNAVLVMGNEANGISKSIREIIQNKLTIPRFGKINQTESLNVATATAILISEFKRNLE